MPVDGRGQEQEESAVDAAAYVSYVYEYVLRTVPSRLLVLVRKHTPVHRSGPGPVGLLDRWTGTGPKI